MDPVRILHSFLEGLQVREPQGGDDLFIVPLQRASRPASRTLSLREALDRGAVEHGMAGTWRNRSHDVILAWPKDEIVLASRRYRVTEPAVVPPSTEARVSLEPLGPAAGATNRSPLAFEGPELACGAALFQGNNLRTVAVIEDPDRMLRILGRRVDPSTKVTAEAANPIQRTREVFESAWFAHHDLVWGHPPHGIMKIKAPQVEGWAAIADGRVAGLELTPRESEDLETGERETVQGAEPS